MIKTTKFAPEEKAFLGQTYFIDKELYIDSYLLTKLKDYAFSDPDNEVCGLITGEIQSKVWFADKFHPIKNINADVLGSRDAYTMDPDESFKIIKNTQIAISNPTRHLIATFHTHPRYTPYPSSIDIAKAAYKVVYIIYSPIYNKFTFNFWNGDFFIPIPLAKRVFL